MEEIQKYLFINTENPAHAGVEDEYILCRLDQRDNLYDAVEFTNLVLPLLYNPIEHDDANDIYKINTFEKFDSINANGDIDKIIYEIDIHDTLRLSTRDYVINLFFLF